MKQLFICVLLTFVALLNTNAQKQNSTTGKFIGVWYYHTSSYLLEPNHNPNDRSLEGQIIKTKKLKGTNETYSVNLNNYPEMIFSKLNEYTLKGINIDAKITFNKNKNIRIYIDKSWMEFKKLK